MKVQLIVVQGRPEGKVIPLVGPKFRIGRGETCHLRPNSEQVSREHAEFSLTSESVSVRDLGSRNGTLVNGKALTGPCSLKDRDLVQVGPLTFAVSIQGASVATMVTAPAAPAKAAPEDVDNTDIEAWLVADAKKPAAPDRPSGIYSGDTITVAAFRDSAPATPEPTPREDALADADSDDAYERLDDEELVNAEQATDEMDAEPGTVDVDDQGNDIDNDEDEDEDSEDASEEEFIDESNPFYAKKKEQDAPAKPVYADTSDAARDILRKMMERRRSARSG
jgi:hypothetical protein